jgi:hypothetical protein
LHIKLSNLGAACENLVQPALWFDYTRRARRRSHIAYSSGRRLQHRFGRL